MATAKEPAIMDWARDHGASVVTLDSDFHALLALHRQVYPSVIRIRMQGLDGPAVAELLRPVVEGYAAELAAGCMGIDTTRVKLTAFVLSAGVAGSSGALAAHFLNTWNARQGSFDVSVTTLAFVILGGSRTWLGPVLGGLVLTALPELLRPVGDVRLVLFGLVILMGPVLAPQGLITPGLLERLGGVGRRERRLPAQEEP